MKKLKWTQEPVSTFQELTKKDLIIKRARALKKARSFFESKHYFEVDCPILSPYAALDNHIDLFYTAQTPPYFLHSSPEYGMKKLLCEGAPSIYQLSHVFRAFESGSKHKEEFMMAEFYKLGINYHDFIEETLEFIQLFTGQAPRKYFTYQEIFLTYLGLDPFKEFEAIKDLVEETLSLKTSSFCHDDILTTAIGALIEPKFDPDCLIILTNFPASQAALSQTFFDKLSGQILAERFEIYFKGLELCNGYNELKDPLELKKRFDVLNQLRLEQDKNSYPIDTALLEAMGKHFPDCCGVACGFDRLLMIELGAHSIKNVSYSF